MGVGKRNLLELSSISQTMQAVLPTSKVGTPTALPPAPARPILYQMHSKFYVSVCHYHCCYLGMVGQVGILQKNEGGPVRVVFLTEEIPHAKASR